MSPLVLLVAGLLVVWAGTAEAKRARFLPGSKPAPAASTQSPVAAATSAPGVGAVVGTAVGLRRAINATGVGGASAAAPQEGDAIREALRNGAWVSETPAPVRPVSLPNPDARALHVLGIGGGDTRPAKGFMTLN
jgi:hypothetical protein